MADLHRKTLREGWEQAQKQAVATIPAIDDAALFDLRNAFYLGAMQLIVVMQQAGRTQDDSIAPIVQQELFAFMTRGHQRPTVSPSRHLIRDGWLEVKRRLVPNNAGAIQGEMVEQLYYCGAIHTMTVVDRAVKMGDLENHDAMHAELIAFLGDLKAHDVSTTPQSFLQWLDRRNNRITIREGWEKLRQRAVALGIVNEADLFHLRNAFYFGAMTVTKLMAEANRVGDETRFPIIQEELKAVLLQRAKRPKTLPISRPIRDCWPEIKNKIVPSDADKDHEGMMLQTYYSGAIHLVDVIHRATETLDRGLRRALEAELNAFKVELTYRIHTDN